MLLTCSILMSSHARAQDASSTLHRILHASITAYARVWPLPPSCLPARPPALSLALPPSLPLIAGDAVATFMAQTGFTNSKDNVYETPHCSFASANASVSPSAPDSAPTWVPAEIDPTIGFLDD